MLITCTSFGFKYGIPSDADLVFDVRCLPNPFYVPSLKNKTGLDQEVRDYVFSHEEARQLYRKIEDLLEFTIPLYEKEGKRQLVVAFGCTGGKHRSVSFAWRAAQALKAPGGKCVCQPSGRPQGVNSGRRSGKACPLQMC